MTFDLLIRGGKCATPSGLIEADIGIAENKIMALGALSGLQAREEYDATHLHILPGLIDSQVHFRDPGFPHKETIETGSRAAIRGGVTSFFDMPNTNPQTLTVEALREKHDRAAGLSYAHFGFFAGGDGENTALLKNMEELPYCPGVKVFMGSSTGPLLVEDDDKIADILQHSRGRVTFHAEDEARLIERKHIAQEQAHPSAHPLWRDEETALKATRRLLALARTHNHPVHILHISTLEELPLLLAHKDIASCEVTPQHLTLNAPDCYERLGTLAQMNPPIRDKKHQDALWKALRAGLFDTMGSDHAPHSREEKAKPYPQSPSGLPGVQTLLPIMLTHRAEGRLSLERLVDLTATGPARLFGIVNKGRIAPGFDADLVIADLNAKRRIENAQMESQCGWTPYDGMETTGWPVATILDGVIVMREDEIRKTPLGRPVHCRCH